jgi:Ca2+-binding EF-hand superfamily protein
LKTKDLSGDGTVDKQEFDQVMKEKGDELNQDQINIFNKIFQQDENSKVTYERMYSLVLNQ